MSNIRNTILGGVFWTTLNQILVLATGIITTAVLTRVLSPGDFGVVAMVTVITGFLNVFRDFGIGMALIQKKEVNSDEYDTIFWLSVLSGATLSIIMFVGAGFLADFYNEPNVTPVARVLAFTFLIGSFGSVWGNLLIKRVDFKHIFYRNLISLVLSGMASIGAALAGLGYWSLVIELYTLLFLNLFFNYRRVQWLPSFTFNKKYVRGLFNFSMPLMADQITNYWTRNVDNLLVGKYLGKNELAYYTKAYTLMLLPVRQISGTITKVLFPSFSLIQDDPEKIASIYLKISRSIAFVTFPLMITLSILSEPLVLLLYGDQWRPVISVFQVLSLLGMFQSIGTLNGNLFLSRGRTLLLFKVGLVTRGCMIAGIVIGLWQGGLMGMVYGYCIGSFFAFWPEFHFAGSTINLSVKRIVTNFAPYLFTGLLVGGAIYFSRDFILQGSILQLFVLGLLSAILYLLLSMALQLKAFVELKALIMELIKKKQK